LFWRGGSDEHLAAGGANTRSRIHFVGVSLATAALSCRFVSVESAYAMRESSINVELIALIMGKMSPLRPDRLRDLGQMVTMPSAGREGMPSGKQA